MNAIRTKHNLDFEACEDANDALIRDLVALGAVPDDDPWGIPWLLFRIGTCEGKWRAVPGAYEILAVINRQPGNGHFEDVLQWFEYACRRDGKALRFLQFENERFRRHLIRKRGFQPDGRHAVKTFRRTVAYTHERLSR